MGGLRCPFFLRGGVISHQSCGLLLTLNSVMQILNYNRHNWIRSFQCHLIAGGQEPAKVYKGHSSVTFKPQDIRFIRLSTPQRAQSHQWPSLLSPLSSRLPRTLLPLQHPPASSALTALLSRTKCAATLSPFVHNFSLRSSRTSVVRTLTRLFVSSSVSLYL